MKSNWLVLLTFTTMITSCNFKRLSKNIQYCESSDKRQALELKRPEDAGSKMLPLVLFIHGGAWKSGGKMFFRPFAHEAIKRGYVAATMNYRLTGGVDEKSGEFINPWPAQIQDVQCAIRFLKKNSNEYGIDSEKIILIGHSAGAHLALIAATVEDDRFNDEMPHQDFDNSINSAISVAGGGSMEQLWREQPKLEQAMIDLLEGGYEKSELNFIESSPYYYASEEMAPVMLIHSNEDTLVDVSNSQIFYEQIKDYDDHEIYDEDLGKHSAVINPLAKKDQEKIIEEAFRFIEKNTK